MQDVILINGSETKTVKARTKGRAVVRSDGETISFTILYEAECGTYHTQEIVCFVNPFRVFFYSSTFECFEDAFLTLSAFNYLKRSDFE
jgi:hypothetical protein